MRFWVVKLYMKVFGCSQLGAGGQDVAGGDIELDVPHTASREYHFDDDVRAVLRGKTNREAGAGAEGEPRRVGFDM